MRADDGGAFWDTVFDVISIAFSVIDVVKEPSNPMNWIGLAGDVIDLVPFVTGVGEVTRAINTGLDIADDIHDTKKTLDRSKDI